jgi:hypothetical protein
MLLNCNESMDSIDIHPLPPWDELLLLGIGLCLIC